MTYSINRNGRVYGPYSRDRVQSYLNQGLISMNDLACIDADLRWVPLSQLLGTPPPAEFSKALFKATTTAFVTPSLILANVLIFAAMVRSGVSPTDPTPQNLIAWGADFGPLTTNGEWWRMLTSAFVHIGIIHILMNIYVLYSIGRLTERLFGHFGFLVLYLLAGVGGSVASLAWRLHTVSAGASGAIFGLYGGLFAFLLLQRHTMPAETLKALASSTGIFLLYNVIFGVVRQGTDMAAHLGGLVSGVCIGLLLAQSPHRATFRSRALRGTLALLLGSAVMAVCAAQIPAAGAEGLSLPGTVTDPAGPPKATVAADKTVEPDRGLLPGPPDVEDAPVVDLPTDAGSTCSGPFEGKLGVVIGGSDQSAKLNNRQSSFYGPCSRSADLS